MLGMVVYFTSLAVVFCAFFAYAIREMRHVAESSAQTTQRALTVLGQVKGLTPHQADPGKVSPAGVPYEVIQQAEVKAVDLRVEQAKAREERSILDARNRFEQMGNAGKVAEMDERLKRLREG